MLLSSQLEYPALEEMHLWNFATSMLIQYGANRSTYPLSCHQSPYFLSFAPRKALDLYASHPSPPLTSNALKLYREGKIHASEAPSRRMSRTSWRMHYFRRANKIRAKSLHLVHKVYQQNGRRNASRLWWILVIMPLPLPTLWRSEKKRARQVEKPFEEVNWPRDK